MRLNMTVTSLPFMCMHLLAEGSSTRNDTESKPCECVNECQMTSFTSAISSSQMSTKTALSDILDLSDILETSDAPERFVAATETRHRVDGSLMMHTMKLLTNAVEAYYHLRGVINFHVIVVETSIATMQSRLLTSLGDMIRGHIADSLQLHGTLSHVYAKHVNYLATGLSAQLRDCDSLTAEVHMITIRAPTTTISSTEEDRLLLLSERLEYLGRTLIDFVSMLDKAAGDSAHRRRYFPNRLLNGDCNTFFQNVNTSLPYLIDWLNSFVRIIDRQPQPVDTAIFTNMTNLRAYMASLSECLMSYKEELDSFHHQMSGLTFNNHFRYEPPVSTLRSFLIGGAWLDEIANIYRANGMSKKQLAEAFKRIGASSVTVPAVRLYDDIETSLFAKLAEIFNDHEKMMVTFYTDLLQRVASLQRFMFANDTQLEQFARRLSIFRMPTFNFQTAQVTVIVILPTALAGKTMQSIVSVCPPVCFHSVF